MGDKVMGQNDQVFGGHQVLCQLLCQVLELGTLALRDRTAHGSDDLLDGMRLISDLFYLHLFWPGDDLFNRCLHSFFEDGQGCFSLRELAGTARHAVNVRRKA